MTEAGPFSCPHRPPCGGCALLDLPLAEQLAWKRERARAALARFPALDGIEVRACVPAPSPIGYRTRAKFAVARPSGEARARIGLFRPGSHEVLDLPRCLVVHPSLLPLLDELRLLLGRATLDVRHVDVRWSVLESRAHVTLVAGGPADPAQAFALAEALVAARPEVSGVGLREMTSGPVPRALGGATHPLLGEAFLVEAIGKARYRLSPGAFFQADPAAAELLHQLVREWLTDRTAGRPRRLCDLYAGVGAFAVALADLVADVTAVESVPAAVEDALASARLSRRDVRVVRAPVERFLAGLHSERADRVVLDPPRRGVPATALRALAAAPPARLAYVSCDPDTLARDLDALLALGLRPRTVVPVDMFSLTDEVEAVALLERPRERGRPTILWRSPPDALAALKPAILPTHPQAPGEESLLAAVRAAEAADDLQPVHRLDVGTSGPVLFARGEALRLLGRAFETGAVEKEYLALVKGVPHKSGRIREERGGRERLPRGARAQAEPGGEETRYRLEKVVGGYGLVRVSPTTGRRHQIRRHLRRIGHPVLGDERYGDPRANRFLAETCALARPFLHLAAMTFAGPDGVRVRLEAPLAPELELVLEKLRALRKPDYSADADSDDKV
jgi:23S rRNA (uracil1939-C5)-methyltransferase